MPPALKRPCRIPGCSALVDASGPSYCPAHARHTSHVTRHTDRARGTAAERGYGWEWQQERLAFLAKYPVCRGTLISTRFWTPELAEAFHALREAARERGQIVAWPAECQAFLAEHPIYEVHAAESGRPATTVDHIVPHKGDPALFWSEWNWQGLTKRAHDRKTGAEERDPGNIPVSNAHTKTDKLSDHE